jgi:hypothetical protein
MYNKNCEIIAMCRHVFWKHYIVLNLYKPQKFVATNVSFKAQEYLCNKQKNGCWVNFLKI